MIKYIFSIAVSLQILLGINNLFAQSVKDELLQLIQDDSVDVNTIAVYSHDVREKIFKVTSHSDGIVKLKDAQNKSNESFKNLISSYSKEDQQKIWNLSRYNNLFTELALTEHKRKKIENVLKSYPKEIYNDAHEFATNHYDLVLAIDNVNKSFNKEFASIISNYSEDDQNAFRAILNMPEAFSLLNENMHLTVHLGSIYKTDPVILRQHFDSLNTVVAEQLANEKEEWKKEMKQNPEAQQEMKQSAEKYAKENGYSEKDYAETDPEVIERYVYVPYPLWSGYPWWYVDPWWYPYPYWYHWGFYVWHGDIIWIGPPSWYFVHWHFHNHHHFHDYPHITNVYINQYYGPRRSVSRNSVEVRSWIKRNESTLPQDFQSNQNLRIDRIREIGKSEIDRQQYNKSNPGIDISREEFIKQHPKEYPHLQKSSAPTPSEISPIEPKTKTLPIEKQDKKSEEIKIDRPVKPSQPKIIESPKTPAKTPEPRQSEPKQKTQPPKEQLPKQKSRVNK